MKNVLHGIKPKGDAIRNAKIAQYKREKACKEKEEVIVILDRNVTLILIEFKTTLGILS